MGEFNHDDTLYLGVTGGPTDRIMLFLTDSLLQHQFMINCHLTYKAYLSRRDSMLLRV